MRLIVARSVDGPAFEGASAGLAARCRQQDAHHLARGIRPDSYHACDANPVLGDAAAMSEAER